LEKDLVGAMEEEGEEAGEGDEVEMKDVVELLSSSMGKAMDSLTIDGEFKPTGEVL
jgi:hypothetical protein